MISDFNDQDDLELKLTNNEVIITTSKSSESILLKKIVGVKLIEDKKTYENELKNYNKNNGIDKRFWVLYLFGLIILINNILVYFTTEPFFRPDIKTPVWYISWVEISLFFIIPQFFKFKLSVPKINTKIVFNTSSGPIEFSLKNSKQNMESINMFIETLKGKLNE